MSIGISLTSKYEEEIDLEPRDITFRNWSLVNLWFLLLVHSAAITTFHKLDRVLAIEISFSQLWQPGSPKIKTLVDVASTNGSSPHRSMALGCVLT